MQHVERTSAIAKDDEEGEDAARKERYMQVLQVFADISC